MRRNKDSDSESSSSSSSEEEILTEEEIVAVAREGLRRRALKHKSKVDIHNQESIEEDNEEEE